MTEWIDVRDRLPSDDTDVNLRVRFTWVIKDVKKTEYAIRYLR